MAIIHQEFYASTGDWYAKCRRDHETPIVDGTLAARYGIHNIEPDDWSGNVDQAGALALADTGWPEGRAKMAQSLGRAIARTQSMRALAYSMDVAGAYPVVPVAVAGDPMCMVTIGEEVRATRPIVRLVCEQWVSAGIEAEQAISRGAAIVAHVDRLEDAGIRCEIVARFSCSANHGNENDGTITDVVAKACDEPVDIDKLAYVLAHPSSVRRLYFRSLETTPNSVAKRFLSGHGRPPKAECRTVEPGQIFLLSANEHTSKYNSPETAAVHVGEMILAGIRAAKDCGFWPMDHAEPELVDAA